MGNWCVMDHPLLPGPQIPIPFGDNCPSGWHSVGTFQSNPAVVPNVNQPTNPVFTTISPNQPTTVPSTNVQPNSPGLNLPIIGGITQAATGVQPANSAADADCSNASLFGSKPLGLIVCNMAKPAFWKSVGIMGVAILLIGGGLLLMLGAEIRAGPATVSNRRL